MVEFIEKSWPGGVVTVAAKTTHAGVKYGFCEAYERGEWAALTKEQLEDAKEEMRQRLELGMGHPIYEASDSDPIQTAEAHAVRECSQG